MLEKIYLLQILDYIKVISPRNAKMNQQRNRKVMWPAELFKHARLKHFFHAPVLQCTQFKKEVTTLGSPVESEFDPK